MDKPIHERSNKKIYNDKITAFLYLLMRNELPMGVVEEIVQEVEKADGDTKFSNGWLADYANDISKRLK